MGTRINGGLRSPAVWHAESHGFIGTDRMRCQPDSMGHHAVGPDGTRWQEGEARPT